VFGAELGLVYEAGDDLRASSTRLHMQPFLSVGFVSAGLRVDVPLGGDRRAMASRSVS
jgi:hypothetical protein